MKLYYVANSRFPSERAHMTQIVAMCNAFANLGHEVTLLVTDRKTSVQETPEAFYGTKLNFSVVRISVPDIAGRSESIPTIFHRYLYQMQRLVFSYKVVWYVKKYPCTHFYGRDEWVLWFISLFTKIPLVWESHEARYSFAGRRLIQERRLLVVISAGIRDFYVRHGAERKKILVAHDAVDERFFKPFVTQVEARKILGISTTKPVVMYIGGLDLWKGVSTFFNGTKGQDLFEVYVIGGKPEEIEMLQTEHDHVQFLGARPYRDLPMFQQAADILVIPNTAKNKLSAEYTSPLKLFAHMTARRPLVVSDVPSIREVLTEQMSYFFIPDNPVSLRKSIMEAILDTEGSNTKSKKAYEESRKYTWEKRADSVIAFIADANIDVL